MSLWDYRMSLEIAKHDYPFYALLMAVMRQADTDNTEKLQAAWPHVWRELQRRYHAPGGILPEEKPPEESGPCAVCQTETTWSGKHVGDTPVWLCPTHGGGPL